MFTLIPLWQCNQGKVCSWLNKMVVHKLNETTIDYAGSQDVCARTRRWQDPRELEIKDSYGELVSDMKHTKLPVHRN